MTRSIARLAACLALTLAVATGPAVAVAHAAPTAAPVVSSSQAAGCTASQPKVTFGWGVYLNACGSVWKAFTAATAVTGGAAVTIGCDVAQARVKSKIIEALCDVGGGKALGWGIDLARKVLKNKSINDQSCYQVKIWAGGKPSFKSVKLKNCQ